MSSGRSHQHKKGIKVTKETKQACYAARRRSRASQTDSEELSEDLTDPIHSTAPDASTPHAMDALLIKGLTNEDPSQRVKLRYLLKEVK